MRKKLPIVLFSISISCYILFFLIGSEIDEDGFLYINPVRADRIVSGGENISPIEIENLLCDHPHIYNAKVYSESDEDWGQIVAAEVSTSLSVLEIRDWLSSKVSGYKIPKKIYIK